MRSRCTLLVTIALLAGSAIWASAAAQDSTMTEELLAGMATEEVEPGVYRVINDGVRKLVVPDAGSPNSWIAIGPGDGIWIFEETTAYRLGDETEYPWEDNVPWAYEITPDGTLWGITFDSAVASFDGQTSTEHARLAGRTHANALAVAPDGTAWVTAKDFSDCPEDSVVPICDKDLLLRIDGTGLSPEDGWQGVHDGRLGGHEPVLSPTGDLWLLGAAARPPESSLPVDSFLRYEFDSFLRYDGTDWHRIAAPEGLSIASGESFGFAPDGTLWAAVASTSSDWPEANDALARLDESGWMIFTEADGMRPWGRQFWFATDYLRVAPDGAVWVNAVTDEAFCDGVARFDGSSWTPYLAGHCIDSFAIASDGGVWVLASEDHADPVYLYIITPEAVTTTK